jgi:hypothetical protein
VEAHLLGDSLLRRSLLHDCHEPALEVSIKIRTGAAAVKKGQPCAFTHDRNDCPEQSFNLDNGLELEQCQYLRLLE